MEGLAVIRFETKHRQNKLSEDLIIADAKAFRRSCTELIRS